ncbi:AbiU2 domain-containing protein [Paraglaciecola chathamensis]|uniref:AbiU2 domain-containing protein n=1 Tax=Paraglaciecola chathamensis TaxID=368405 RepID=UPI00068AC69E|nr:hypothetical protein [Paraglaciecola chathamensis]
MDDSTRLRQGLCRLLTQAEIDFEMWQAMRDEKRNKKFQGKLKRYSRFYIAAENALFNSLIIILYKTVENRKDTININSYKKSLTGNISEDTQFALSETEKRIKPLVTKICILRNNTVGHQSVSLAAGDVYDKADLWVSEISQLINDLQELVYILAKDVQDTHVTFNLKGTQSFKNLVDDLTC